MATAARGSNGDASTSQHAFTVAGVALCRAARVADRPEKARQVFFDAVHQPLHELADETATRDRSVAAHLLEAKQAVPAPEEASDVPT